MTPVRETKVISDQNYVCIQLPFGKLKNEQIVDQKAQTGHNCVYYAIKSILTDEQIHSAHGKHCKSYRKTITSLGLRIDSIEKHYQGREKANRIFLESNGINPDKAAEALFMKVFCIGSGMQLQSMPKEAAAAVMNIAKEQVITQTPWYHIQQIDTAASQLIAKGHGLKEVPYKEFETLDRLSATLKKMGPLVITGPFCKLYYCNKEASQKNWTFAGKNVYGWSAKDPKSDIGLTHAVVITGTELRDGNALVYWNDPNYPNLANAGQKTFVSSLKSIQERIRTIDGSQTNKIFNAQIKSTCSVAYANPQLKLINI
jgi:hypothetical protein